MASFPKNGSIADYQKFVADVYGSSDGEKYSLFDLLSQQERFTLRAIKGIRRDDMEKMRVNLLIISSWLASVANRLNIDLGEALWKRFPGCCSYCGGRPCACKEKKIKKRLGKIKMFPGTHKPHTMSEAQKEMEIIYPAASRNLALAGIHLIEEMGETGEAMRRYYSSHNKEAFAELEKEFADYLSCIFDVANSNGIDYAAELSKSFADNCNLCHEAPCTCSITDIENFES